MIAYSHKEEADTKGNSRDPEKKEPVHHRKITRKQKSSFSFPGISKKKKKPSMKHFQNSFPKNQESNRKEFRETAIPSEKAKEGKKTENLGSP